MPAKRFITSRFYGHYKAVKKTVGIILNRKINLQFFYYISSKGDARVYLNCLITKTEKYVSTNIFLSCGLYQL